MDFSRPWNLYIASCWYGFLCRKTDAVLWSHERLENLYPVCIENQNHVVWPRWLIGRLWPDWFHTSLYYNYPCKSVQCCCGRSWAVALLKTKAGKVLRSGSVGRNPSFHTLENRQHTSGFFTSASLSLVAWMTFWADLVSNIEKQWRRGRVHRERLHLLPLRRLRVPRHSVPCCCVHGRLAANARQG